MKILLFSRSQPGRSAEELRRLLDALDRCGLDYDVNEEFAAELRTLTGRDIPASETTAPASGNSPPARRWCATAATAPCWKGCTAWAAPRRRCWASMRDTSAF